MIEADAIVIEAGEQLAVRCGAVLVWITAGQLDDAPLVELRDGLEAMARDQPQGVALLLVALGEGELPKINTRRRIVRGLSSLGDRLQAVAVSFEGDKPWLAQALSTFEAIFAEVRAQVRATVVGDRFPMRVFGDRMEAVVWLGEVVVGPDQRPIETEGLATVIDETCARLEDPR
ncbi:hypothetical protein ENSA5_67830 [Enhygromyxa salina]|uniref:Uncharacterized protein n=1 Tax=Enhygromyxa salina TaxID=215803 RepID=A0A2S9XBE1_9BACT|nr:hypothetical protein [Enhygromyxa salina]PRP90110.1 hypothetical protein ENSA5_67830 [Enhygromyxa salina]